MTYDIYDEMLTVEQAATLAGVDASAIRLAIRQGDLRAWALPMLRGLLVRESDVRQWAAGKVKQT